MRRAALATIALTAAGATAFAHDLWIDLAKHRVAVGDEVPVSILVGMNLAGERVKRDDARLDRFVAVAPSGTEVPIAGKSGDEPAGRVRVDAKGLWVLAFATKPKFIELEPAKFESYLTDEGLERVSAERRRLGESEKKSRENYARCAKALVVAGGDDAATTGFDRVLGLRLELVPHTDPLAAKPGDELAFELLFDGKPLEGAKVVARPFAAPAELVSARTDSKGRVALKTARAGRWYVGCVHMIRSEPEKTLAEWESFWASVTFEVPEKRAAPLPADAPKTPEPVK